MKLAARLDRNEFLKRQKRGGKLTTVETSQVIIIVIYLISKMR